VKTFLSTFKNQITGIGIAIGLCITLGATGQAGQKKNLLFIITDQQRYDALSIAGNSVLETPNLDRIAQQGVYFRNAYTPCAVCGPARSSILTGCTVENTGVKTNGLTYYEEEEGLMTMPTFDEILTDHGYHCEYYGKWHSQTSHTGVYKNPVQEASNGKSIFGPGGQSHIWRDYLNTVGPKPEPGAGEFVDGMSKWPYVADPLDRYFGLSYQELVAQNKVHSQPDQHGELTLDKEHTLTAFQAKQTLEAIERLKDTIFSITCSFHFPHAPMLPPEPYYSMYPAENMLSPASISDDMQNSPYTSANGRVNKTEYADPEKIKYMISNYYGLVKEIDDWVGKILDKLDTLGLAENTMVIFTSDHGEMLGAHGMREKNVFYEESAHIPLLMRFPNEIDTVTQVDGYVSLIDLFPTIIDYLEIGTYESDGKSLRGLIEGTDQEHGNYVVTEWDYRGETEPNYMIVKDGWKLIIPYTKSSTVLNAMFDLNTDPHEMNNLLGDNPDSDQYLEKAEELRTALLEWLEKNNSQHYYGVAARVLVDDGTQVYNNASFVSQSVPISMDPGETASVSVTMRNTRTSTWIQDGGFKLGSQNPADNEIWGLNRVILSAEDSIAPNAEKTFTFDITAPANVGTYNFQWRMLQEQVEWFGDLSNNVVITVGDVPVYFDDCDEKTDWKSSQGLSRNTTDNKQGTACIEFTGSSTDEFKKIFSTPYNSGVTEANGVLQFWYYVSDASLLGTSNQVEIGSAGKPDENEYHWKLTGLSTGWNLISLNISDASTTGGAADLSAINWFRLYNNKSGIVTSRIDAIQILDNSVGTSNKLTVHSTSKEPSVNIYPNPLTEDLLSIDLSGFDHVSNVNVRIYNPQGQTIYNNTTKNRKHIEISTDGLLEKSVYFVLVQSGQRVARSKIIVAK